jgi:hypothetical protein
MEENRTQTASGETQWPKAGLNIRQSANLYKKIWTVRIFLLMTVKF